MADSPYEKMVKEHWERAKKEFDSLTPKEQAARRALHATDNRIDRGLKEEAARRKETD